MPDSASTTTHIHTVPITTFKTPSQPLIKPRQSLTRASDIDAELAACVVDWTGPSVFATSQERSELRNSQREAERGGVHLGPSQGQAISTPASTSTSTATSTFIPTSTTTPVHLEPAVQSLERRRATSTLQRAKSTPLPSIRAQHALGETSSSRLDTSKENRGEHSSSSTSAFILPTTLSTANPSKSKTSTKTTTATATEKPKAKPTARKTLPKPLSNRRYVHAPSLPTKPAQPRDKSTTISKAVAAAGTTATTTATAHHGSSSSPIDLVTSSPETSFEAAGRASDTEQDSESVAEAESDESGSDSDSDSDSEEMATLSRPRGVVRYQSPLPRTAFTPPRLSATRSEEPRGLSSPLRGGHTGRTDGFADVDARALYSGPVSGAGHGDGRCKATPTSRASIPSSSSASTAGPSTSTSTSSSSRPLHPFFSATSRSKSTPLPASHSHSHSHSQSYSAYPAPSQNKPRFVAHHSSTDTSSQQTESQSQSQASQNTQSTFGDMGGRSPSPPRLSGLSLRDGPGPSVASSSKRTAIPDIKNPPPRRPTHTSTNANASSRSGKSTEPVRAPPAGWSDREVDNLIESMTSIGIRPKTSTNAQLPRATGKSIKAAGSGGSTATMGSKSHNAHPNPLSPEQKSQTHDNDKKVNDEANSSSVAFGSSTQLRPTASRGRSAVYPNVNVSVNTRTHQPLRPSDSLRPQSSDKVTPSDPQPQPQPQRQPQTGSGAATEAAGFTSPFFHFASLPRSAHNPIKIAYTTDPSEANDLLSCLRGPYLGFDLEWPVPGEYKITNKFGVTYTKRVGMEWTPHDSAGPGRGKGAGKWSFRGQGRTALMQVCDKDLVVLVHLKDMTELPSKAVEMIQDPKLFKLGVAVRGDGQKLLRDFPNQITSASSLFELSWFARKVDPIQIGPGNRLIKLANLAEMYLGKPLDKDEKVRKSHWAEELSKEQMDYAANDVYASFMIYQAIQARADEAQLRLDPLTFCSHLGDSPLAAIAVVPVPVPASTGKPPVSAVMPTSTRPGGPTPSEGRALSLFMGGLGSEEAAREMGLKQSTVQTYIAGALAKSDPDIMSLPEKQRFLIDTANNIWVARNHGALVKRLKREVGEIVSDSEPEMNEVRGS